MYVIFMKCSVLSFFSFFFAAKYMFVSHSGCMSPEANDWLSVQGLLSTLSSDSSCYFL